jgi:biotin carboxyl carrier protein
MTNNLSQIPSAYGLTGINTQPKSPESSTTDIISSFKEILSTMMMSGSGLSSDQQSGSGINSGVNDMMAPLMMIMLLEKLVAGQMDQSASSSTTSIEASTNQLQKSEPSGRPVGGVITQNFHPGHNGLDFGVVVGTPVKATMDGKVMSAGWNNQGYGNLVIVENGAYRTYYAHLSSIPVAVGDEVSAGTTIGLSGNTGNSTGPHLHYEIRKDKLPIDPTSITLGADA